MARPEQPRDGSTDRATADTAPISDGAAEQPTLYAEAEATPEPAGALEAIEAPTQVPTAAATTPGRQGARDADEATAAVGPADEWVGREVQGRYRILDKLGEGGMGMVYVAEHIHLKKRVAFKVIHPELAADEELLARFTREALATGQLDHAHICAAIDYEKLPNGSAFLVMPFVRGHSLQAEFDSRGALPWRSVCRYGAQIADALSAAHALGIIHRDLKPDNVLIEQRADGSQSAKVLDFGVASLTGQSRSISSDTARPLTQAGMILGTPGYMSPEQATAGEVDERTDLYALGVLLWELTTGRRLFDGKNVTEIFAKQFHSVPRPLGLGEWGPARSFSELVTSLLSAQKDGRPRSAAEVRDTLRRLAETPEPPVLQVRAQQLVREVARRWQALDSRRQVAVALAAVALLGLAGASLGGDGSPAAKEAAEPEAEAQAEAPQKAPPAPEKERGEDDADDAEGNLLDDVGALLGGELPEPLKAAQDTLFEGGRRADRVEAARSVLDYERPEKVPEYLKLSAELEVARGCRGKRGELRKLIELGDAAARPLVERLDATPRRGCAPFNLRDCYACMRSDIAEALEALQ